MPLNPYFLQGSTTEQRLVQDLINEQLKMFGQDVVYLPRQIVNKTNILNEVTASKFDDAFRIEAYLMNYEGFEGSGDILTKFGVQTTDSVTFVISKERYEDFISPFLDDEVELTSRPQEGDLIYFPLDNTIFEIKYVEAKKPFYQLNKLYAYTLSCEVFDMALDEQIDTGIEAVDKAAVEFGFTVTLAMVGLGADTATATVQKATTPSGLNSGFGLGYIDLINDGTAYQAPPSIGISTAPVNGVNATAVAIMTSRTGQTGTSIDRILLVNPGFGYTAPPTVTITPVNEYGSGGIATAVLSDGGLSAFNITDAGSQYGTVPTVSIGTAPAGGVNATAEAFLNTNNEIAVIRFTNAGAGYTVAPTVTIGSPAVGVAQTGDYLFKEMVRGVGSGTTAFVQNWDHNDRILKVTNLSGNFIEGEKVVGIGTTLNGSDAQYIVKSISNQDETDLFGDNNPFETEADAILDFSERNPFGEF